MIADEEAASGRRSLCRLAGQYEEAAVAENAGAARIGRIIDACKLRLGRGKSIEASEVGIYKRVVRREELHEVLVAPDEMIKQPLGFFHHGSGDVGVEIA